MPSKVANDLSRSDTGRIGDEEWSIRVDLAAAYRLAALYGWDELIFTHFSARLPGPEHHFLINPFGLLFEEITASSLVRIDSLGQPVAPTAYTVNPAGFTIHSAVHDARSDALAVLHVHTVAGTAVASQADGLLPLTQNAFVVLSDLAYHDYEGLALEAGEKGRLVADLGNRNAMLLRNHGLLVIGASVAEAFIRLYFLQRACEIQIAAQAGGGALVLPGEKMGETVAAQAAHGFDQPAQLAWNALRRKLDRLDPAYKQ